ncbi:hypothetical protein [Maribacter sp. 2307ULW6-5]
MLCEKTKQFSRLSHEISEALEQLCGATKPKKNKAMPLKKE